MAKKLNDLCVVTGKYQDLSGNEKPQWENIGSELLTDDGKVLLFLKPWINLAGIPHENGKQILVNKFPCQNTDKE